MSFTRRNLPHWFPEGAAIFITWRLAGSLPPGVVYPGAEPDARRSPVPPALLHQEELLDQARCGPTWLKDPRIANVVAGALLYGETVRRYYDLHAWVVMPNHVHAVLQPNVAMPTIMRWLKGRTSRVANRLLGNTGTPFWQDESFDHWIRADELPHLIDYVENNPVKAGLAPTARHWRWSSAGTGAYSGQNH